MFASALASAGYRMISRVQAFADQGVTLAYPARSWSGVRDEDGAVVIAIREGEIQSSFDGFRCLLWSPVIEGATEWLDRPIKQERLHHCRLAALFGGAEGLLVSGASAQVARSSVLSLRVEKLRGEYWAFWGSAALAPGLSEILRADPAYAYGSHEQLRMAA
jgi:hypothetical protein